MWMLGALLLLCDHQQSFRAIAAENEVGQEVRELPVSRYPCKDLSRSRLFIEPRMWGSRSKRPRPLLGGWRRQVGSPLRARVCSLRSPLPIAQLALVPLPSIRPLFSSHVCQFDGRGHFVHVAGNVEFRMSVGREQKRVGLRRKCQVVRLDHIRANQWQSLIRLFNAWRHF